MDDLSRPAGPALWAASGEEDEYFQEHFYNNHPSIFSDKQLLILETTGIVTGVPSLIGSSLIIYSILKENRFRARMYQRIMLGLSSCDCIVSFHWIFLGPWVVPRQVQYVLGGKAETFVFCNVSGFLMHFIIGTLWYSAFLALYFALFLGHELKEPKIKRYFEPLMHTITLIFPLITGIYAVQQKLMNPIELLPGNCWMDYYCDDQVCRGMKYYLLSLFCGTITAGITFMIVLICMIRIIVEVYKTEKKIIQYWNTENSNEDHVLSLNLGGMLITRETCVKALLYIGAYILTVATTVGIQVCPLDISVENQRTYFILGFLTKFFLPLQGFFNCLIYFRYKTSTQPVRSRLSGHPTIMAFTEPHREEPQRPTLQSSCSCNSFRVEK